jgi:hypothetical protein
MTIVVMQRTDCTHAVSPRVRCKLEHLLVLNIPRVAKLRITIVAYTILTTTKNIGCVQKIKSVYHSLIDIFEVRMNKLNQIRPLEKQSADLTLSHNTVT